MNEGEKVYIELKNPISDYEQAIIEAEEIGEEEDLFDNKVWLPLKPQPSLRSPFL